MAAILTPGGPARQPPIFKRGAINADLSLMTGAEATAIDGVRLLSHRPSVLYKVEHLATEPVEGDLAVDGLVLAGPGWSEKLRELLKTVSASERACLFALRLSDDQALP